jgi:hypothetical protein
MAVRLEWHRQGGRWLGNTWPQGHMRAAGVVMGYPLAQDPSQMVCAQRNQQVEALPPQRADKPLTERIRLRTLGRRFENSESKVVYVLVKRLRDNAVAVMHEKPVAVVSWNGLTQLLQRPGRRGVRRNIGMLAPR